MSCSVVIDAEIKKNAAIATIIILNFLVIILLAVRLMVLMARLELARFRTRT